MQARNKIEWTEERIATLREYYEVESNEKLAERLGISSRTLVRKAKELNIYKPKAVTKSAGLDDIVRELYKDHSFLRLASRLIRHGAPSSAYHSVWD